MLFFGIDTVFGRPLLKNPTNVRPRLSTAAAWKIRELELRLSLGALIRAYLRAGHESWPGLELKMRAKTKNLPLTASLLSPFTNPMRHDAAYA